MTEEDALKSPTIIELQFVIRNEGPGGLFNKT
jgi:hypothetical protein